VVVARERAHQPPRELVANCLTQARYGGGTFVLFLGVEASAVLQNEGEPSWLRLGGIHVRSIGGGAA
jgi:hypothetical protein